jgi:hypothetical protein
LELNRIFDSIVRIDLDFSRATGFFLQIKIRDRELNCLVTNEHVISQVSVTLKKTIFLYYGQKEKEIKKIIRLDESERFIRCFGKPKDITIVEIKNYDYIPNYKFLQPDLSYKSGYNQYLYKKYYLAGYPKADDYLHQNERHISSGLITKIGYNYFEFEHSLDRRVGSSGSPICLLDNQKVVGVHKANRYEEEKFGNYSINIATFIGIIIDELDDEYYLLPKINKFEDFKYGYEEPMKKELVHSKTQNFIDFNSLYTKSSMDFPTKKINSIFTPKINTFGKLFNDLDRTISNMMDKSFSNFETEFSMKMNLFGLDFDFGFGTKNTYGSKISFPSLNDKHHHKAKKEKNSKNKRSRTPLNFECSLFGIYNTFTQNKCNYNNYNIYNGYTSTKSSIRIENKSYEPKLKHKKKRKINKKKITCNAISKVNNMYNIHSIKNEGIASYSNISNYDGKSNYCGINIKNGRFKAKIGNSRNFCCYSSKSYDNITTNINTEYGKTKMEINTMQSSYGYYENNFANYDTNYYL